jgi:V8-like Glu-specific endopeptidase
MSRFLGQTLAVLLALTVLLPGFGRDHEGAHAQETEQEGATTLSFNELDFKELITSTVLLVACDNVRPSSGSIDLATFERTGNSCWHGSGTVIDPGGIILTNAHVALDSTQDEPLWILVQRTVDARSLPQPAYFARAVLYSPAWGARRSFGDAQLDLAIIVPALTLDGSPIQAGDVAMRPLPMTEAGTVDIGDELRNIGYPGIGGALITITQGSVSGFEPDDAVQQLGNAAWIKTDATLGGGISGGTTINENGLLIGVPTELGDTEVRTSCLDQDTGDYIPCPIGQINHIRPIPEGFHLLSDIGLGDGMPEMAAPNTNTPGPSEPPPVAPDAVTVTGSVVSADTGQPVAGAWFIVLQPGVPVADYLNGQQDVVYTFATSGADGGFQLKKPVTRGEAYGVAVIARGYDNMSEDGRVLAAPDAGAVVTLPPVQMAVQR